MSLLDNDIELFENTDLLNLGFPRYCDFDFELDAYVWKTQYYGDSIVKEGIQIGIQDEFIDVYMDCSKIKHCFSIYICIGTYLENPTWRKFMKIADIFETPEDARKWAYKILCFLKEHRDFFEKFRLKYDCELNDFHYRIPKPILIKEIYNYNNYESIR